MKKFTLFVLVGIGIGGALIIGFRPLKAYLFPQEEFIEIALVGPMGGAARANGEAMRRGVQLYLDQVNYKSALGGRTIRLQIVNDQNNSQIAAKRASDIALGNKVLLVLGHYASNTSLAASEVYQKNGIPALTASATDDLITRSNEWYFRTIPNNTFQGEFIAQYVKHVLQQKSTSIIVDQDSYGSSLDRSYENAVLKLEIKVNKRWGFDKEASDIEQQLKTIIAELRGLEEPGAIFFATHEIEAAKIITAIKFPGANYTIVGPDTFAAAAFLEEFRQHPQEQVLPGYYSDGIYAVSPFIGDLATNEAQQFRLAFKRAYGEEPTWEAACYYDAMAVAVQAIQRAEIEGKDLHADRKKVREALADLANPDLAVPGVTGTIYFDQARDVRRPLSVGIYTRQHLQPAYTQYHIFSNLSDKQQWLSEKGIQIHDLTMIPNQVVSAGIDCNEISHFDLREGAYTADFYLWFRFQDNFPDTALTFLNAVTPITLKTPVLDKQTPDGLTVRAYHVKAIFKGDLRLDGYPFDQPVLSITFRHATNPITSLRYIPDLAGLPSPVQAQIKNTEMNALTGWKVKNFSNLIRTTPLSQKAPNLDSTPIPVYSQFTAIIELTREGVSMIIAVFAPLLILAVVVYLIYYLPIDRLGMRIVLGATILLTNTIYAVALHTSLLGFHFRLIDWAFLTVYVLTALATSLSIVGYFLHKRGAPKALFLVNLAGRIMHPVLIGLVSVGFVLAYVVLSQKIFVP